MILNFIFLAALAIATVLSVRYVLIKGIDNVCTYFNLSSKSKGQIIGYSTSVPEFTVVIASAFAGVFDAGLWNIVSSNIINWLLFIIAVFFYGQQKDILNRKFLDEIFFASIAVVIPLFLSLNRVGLNVPVALGLILLFGVYKLIDRLVNPRIIPISVPGSDRPRVFFGILLLISGIILVVFCGMFLGQISERLIHQLGTPAWAIGWILGLITSIPELASFFEIFRIHKKRGTLSLTDDMQEALDTLVASNLSNLGIILPIGLFVFILVT